MKIEMKGIIPALVVLLFWGALFACGDDDDDLTGEPDLSDPCVRYFMECHSLPAEESETQCGTYYNTDNPCLIAAADELFACVDQDCDRWAECSAAYETQAESCL